MPEIIIEFEVWCKTCGKGLCSNTTVKDGKIPQLYIIPCDSCMLEEHKRGMGLSDDFDK